VAGMSGEDVWRQWNRDTFRDGRTRTTNYHCPSSTSSVIILRRIHDMLSSSSSLLTEDVNRMYPSPFS
jgi:hypothetical protein